MKVKMIVLEHCPYCKNAKSIIEKMQEERPELRKFEFNVIDEAKATDELQGLSYYYVPTFFAGEEKLYEASPEDKGNLMIEKIEGVFARLEELSK